MTNKAYEKAQNDRRLRGAEYRKARRERWLAANLVQTSLCSCFEIAGDNENCLVHYPKADGSDNSQAGQLNEAGFGSGGAF